MKRNDMLISMLGCLVALTACSGGGESASGSGNSGLQPNAMDMAAVGAHVSSQTYDFALSKDIYGNPVIGLQFNGFSGDAAPIQSIEVDSSMRLMNNGFFDCLGLDNSLFTITYTTDPSNGVYLNLIEAKPNAAKFSMNASSACGNFVFQDPNSFGTVMPSQLSGYPIVNPQIKHVKINYVDGTVLNLSEPSAPTETDPGNGKYLGGYFASWSIYNGQNYGYQNIPVQRLNTIHYAFVYFDTNDGHVYAGDYNSDGTAMPGIATLLRQHASYLKGVLSFGGWTNFVGGAPQFSDQRFTQMTSGPNAARNIDNFAETAVAAMRKLGFSGIDIDWEWWASTSAADFDSAYASRMLALYDAIREKLDSAAEQDGFGSNSHHYKLSVALPVSQYDVEAQESAYPGYWNHVNGTADYLNVMAYDMHGNWDGAGQKSYFQAAMNDASDPYPDNGSAFSIQKGLDSYSKYVPNLNKFSIGIPAYGRAMEVGNSSAAVSSAGVNQNLISGANVNLSQRNSQGSSSWDYACIVDTATCLANGQNTLTNLTLVNQQTHASYAELWNLYNGSASLSAWQPWAYAKTVVSGAPHWIFISYDDVDSASAKTNFVLSHNLAGLFVWELDGDHPDSDKSLLQAISTTLTDPVGR